MGETVSEMDPLVSGKFLTPVQNGGVPARRADIITGRAPTAEDDADQGYHIGSNWADNSVDGDPIFYRATDVTPGAAVWFNETEGAQYAKDQGDYAKTQGDAAQIVVGAGAEILDARDQVSTDKSLIDSQINQARADLIPLGDNVRFLPPQTGGGGRGRIRIGNRLLGWIDANGLQMLRNILSQSGTTMDDQPAVQLKDRIFGDAIGSAFRSLPASWYQGFRWRIGNRLLMTIDIASGVYPRRMTIPATAKVDDNPNLTLVSRLLTAAVGNYFGRLVPQTGGGILRIRLGNRELARWSPLAGIQWSRQTLPADCKIADKPTINLLDRLGSSVGSSADNGSYTAFTKADAVSGKRVVSTMRSADRKQFNALSPSNYNAFVQRITADSKVIFYADQLDDYLFVPAEGGTAYRVYSDTLNVDAWGDSLTMGTGSSGTGAGQGSFPKQLQDLMGAIVTINNYGQGGQTSTEVAGRQGGTPALMTVTGNQIPANGSVTLTAYSQDILLLGARSGNLTLQGSLAGVAGTLTGNNTTGRGTSTYTFTRSAAGSAVACPPNTPFIPALGVTTQDRLNIIKIGRNGPSWSQSKADYAACVAYLKSLYKRIVIGGQQNAVTEAGGPVHSQFLSANADLLALYGDDYVEVNTAPTIEEMAAIGFVPDSYGIYANFHTDAGDIAGKAMGGYSFQGLPANGDTASINGSAVTFVAGAPSGSQVQIGADTVSTAAALAVYINANTAGLGVTALSGTDNTGVVRINLTANVAGSGGNSLTLSTSSSALTASGATLACGNANPVMPSGMMWAAAQAVGGDWLHRNNLGYALEALRIYRKLYSRGWFPSLVQK